MTLPDDWTREDHIEYSPSRYDPDEVNDECLKCGTELEGFGDRVSAYTRCPGCDVMVMMI